MDEPDKLNRFEQTVLPHLDAAQNLARWLTGNAHDAQDVVQDAFLRAYKFFAGFRGGDPRAWLLTIVRNSCYSWLQRNRAAQLTTEFDETAHPEAPADANPRTLLIQSATIESVRAAIEELPLEFREAFILRELEGLSYKEIAGVAEIPIGTVMSRLARARALLQRRLLAETKPEDQK